MLKLLNKQDKLNYPLKIIIFKHCLFKKVFVKKNPIEFSSITQIKTYMPKLIKINSFSKFFKEKNTYSIYLNPI